MNLFMKLKYVKTILLAGVLFLGVARVSHAAIVTCGNQNNGTASDGCTLNDLISSSVTFTDYLFAAAAVVAVGGVVYAGYKMVTSAGNASRQAEGKKTLVNSIIGLIIILLAVLSVSSLKSILGYRDTPLIEYTATVAPPPGVQPVDPHVVVAPPPVNPPAVVPPAADVLPVTPPVDTANQPPVLPTAAPPVSPVTPPVNNNAPQSTSPLQAPSPMQNVLSWINEHCDLLAGATADNIRDLMRGIPNAGALRGHGIF